MNILTGAIFVMAGCNGGIINTEVCSVTMSDTDARRLVEALQAAPSSVAVFDSTGRLVFHTHQLMENMPQIKDGLVAFLDSLQKTHDTVELLDALDECEEVDFIARQPGDERYWEVRINGSNGSDVTPVFIRDVSEREERDRIQRMVLELVEKSLDPIGIARPNHRGLYVNKAMRELFGVPVGTPPGALSIEDVQGDGIGAYSVDQALEKAAEDGPYYADTVLKNPVSGESLYVSQLLMAHYDPLDGQTYFSTAIRDVTASKRLEENLLAARRELEQLLMARTEEWMRSSQQAEYSRQVWHSLVDQNADLILFTDEQGRILYSNRGFLPDENASIAGWSIFDLVGDEKRQDMREHFRLLVARRRGHFSLEADFVLDGGQAWNCIFSVNYVVLKDAGHSATWTISDISSEREAREQLAISEQMAAAGRIAARIAHEINNPLAAIKNSVSLIRMDFPEEGETREYLDLMEKELARVSHIIRQMYGLYQFQTEPAPPVRLCAVCDEVVMLLRAQAGSRNVSLDVEGDCDCMTTVPEASLRQVLFNVIINAIDASPDGGVVSVQIAREGDRALVNVIDQGPGINPADIQQLFEPFYTTKETYSGKGLGLGLPVSLSIIRGVGGTISLEPLDGGGTCCRISLPVVCQDK